MAMALTMRSSGMPRCAATSSHRVFPGVSTFRIVSVGACLGPGVRATRHRLLPGTRQHVELVRSGAADRSRIGGDHAEPEPEAREYPRVSVVHVPVLALEH